MNNVVAQRRIIAVSAMVTFAVGIIAGVQKGNDLPTARFIVGIGFAYTIVSLMNDLGMSIGAGFALLIMVSAMFREGDSLFSWLQQRGAKTPEQKNAQVAKKANRAVRQNVKQSGQPFNRQTVFPNFTGRQFQPTGGNN